MKKAFFTFSLLMSVVATFAQKEVNSNITDVTVFLNSAQITRQAGISLKPGENQFVITGLPQSLQDNSVQVEGNSDFTIHSVKTQTNYLSEQELSPEIQQKKDSLEELKFKLSMRQSLENVYINEKEMILANKSIKGEQSLLVEDLQEAAEFFREHLTEIEYKLLELRRDQKKLNEEIQRLQQQLNNMMGRFNRNTKEITIRLSANKSVNTSLNVSYVVYEAGWTPSYDIRSEDINSPVTIAYKARVRQSTGNDWNDVNLTLSTGNPTLGGQKPDMNPWYLHLYDPEAYQKSKSRYQKQEAAPAMEMDDMEMQSGGVTANLVEVSQVQSLVNTEFQIEVPYTIPSDNQEYDVLMKEINMNADYNYFTVPKLDEDAFLVAQITDWEQYSLLPGESNIYYQGTYVGNAYIDPAVTTDTLSLSLGRDESVVVERESIKDFSKTTIFGSKKQTIRSYEISVVNNKQKAIDITVVDQIPLSRTEEVEVTAEELSGGKLDSTTGEVTWKMSLQPGETQKRTIKFVVKYPKKKVIGNL